MRPLMSYSERTFPEDVWLMILHHVLSQSCALLTRSTVAVQEEIAFAQKCLTITIPKGTTDHVRSQLLRDYTNLLQTQCRPPYFCQLLLKANSLLRQVPEGGATMWLTPDWFHMQRSDPSFEMCWFKPLCFNEAQLDGMIPASL